MGHKYTYQNNQFNLIPEPPIVPVLPYTAEENEELAKRKLQDSDWSVLPDVNLQNKAEWETYRSALRAIAINPEIIFFDEPTTGLDPIMADVINNLIVANSKQLGATTLTITHDMHSARKIADKVAMLYQGRFIWFGSVDDLYSSGNEFVEQ